MKNKKSGFSLLAFFSSLKLTIFLLITLATVSIIGTVIPQNEFKEQYLRYYQESTYEIFKKLGFLDMYHSWWFTTILVLFALNLIICSLKHFPRTGRFFREPVTTLSDSFLLTLAHEWRTRINARGRQLGELADEVGNLLAGFWAGKWQRRELEAGDGSAPEVHFFAQRGLWSRLGVYVVHSSIIVIFIGGIVGSLFGLKGYVNILEGDKTAIIYTRNEARTPVELGFTVECRSFNVEFYDNGAPKEYTSDLVIYENGQKKLEKTIEVNHPLSYRGYTFYQSSYGTTGGRVKLRVHDSKTGKEATLTLAIGDKAALPESDSWVMAAQYEPNYMNLGPAVRLVLPTADGRMIQFWVFQKYPQFDQQNRKGRRYFVLEEVNRRYYTGLQVTKDPGVWIVWLGCTLMVGGLFVAFFISHRRLWVRLRPDPERENRIELVAGGSANKNQPAFEKEFAHLTALLEEKLKGKK